MTQRKTPAGRRSLQTALPCVIACSSLAATAQAAPDRWGGPFAIVPVSAPEMVMEAVGSGTTPGTVVSIGRPTGGANQRWMLVPRGDDLYLIRPSYSETLALAAAAGSAQNGTPVVLETYADKPWQAWHIRRNRVNGSVCLVPQHAPDKGLDDFGGRREAGARQDLWEYRPSDEHLQWTLRPLAGALFPPDLPKGGVIKECAFTESAIFPGTGRNITVFIPAEYDGRTPACVYVRQDGYNAAEKGMLEALIAAGEMPVTVGVFVTPGEVPAPMDGTLGRRNRCFEYDGMGDNYVRFLTEEVLPFVARKFDLKLSTRGTDRCIAGGSSGGIAAFNAAWERPDAFSRVYANSGSFVAFRGGHEFPTLIRKCEPRPLRAYLTTGTQDMENCAGDWYLIDLEMDKALKFSGYDYVFHAIEGPHVVGWNEHFPEAMRFLWRGWPEPIHAGPGAPRVRDILVPGSGWVPAGEGYGDARGPACNSRGEVFFVDAAHNRVHRIGLDSRVTVFLKDAGHATALSVGPHDELYTVSPATARIMCYDAEGHGRVYATGIAGQYVLARPEGGVYVTVNGAQEEGAGQIWWVKDGHKRRVGDGPKRATGLAYRPDRWLLSVADGHSKWVYSYRVEPDGGLADRERYFWLHVADGDDDAGPESVCYAREGQMFVATRMGIQVCADDGPTQVILPLPDHRRVVGVCLGGADQNVLFAFCGDRIWRRAVQPHTLGAFTPWQKVNGSPL